MDGDAALDKLMDDANRDPRMKTAYLDYLAAWAAAAGPGALFNHFTNCDGWSKYGRWGAREYPGQPLAAAPKADALMTYIDTHPLPA